MTTNESYYKDLLIGFIRNSISLEQVKELYAFIDNAPQNYGLLMDDPDVIQQINLQMQDQQVPDSIDQRLMERLATSMADTPVTGRTVSIGHWKRWFAAASVLLILSVAGYFVFFNKTAPQTIVKADVSHDVKAPATNKATITLSDGSILTLDSAANGTLATQGNIKVVKNGNGDIAYQSATGSQSVVVQYNTLFNPRGSKAITLTLSDGTQVWLNAESSLRYPTAFSGTERKVEIIGEAYFEVAHNTAMPFKVTKGDLEVTVLGTHFNVNAYDDETSIKVTLLEGAVSVVKGNDKGILKPGDQASINTGINIVHNADLEEAVAWKNGKFQFGSDADLTMVMRQISRWYDVDIIYAEKIDLHFWGSMSRLDNVSKVLEKLELTGSVRFKIEGRKITVMR